ncbi:MAG: glycoside hydrolase family 13 protein [Anaerolineaceae bacterium]|nr:glycoside hydrolase family 13 protein [Anaerolineaceae bacterium]
MPVDRSFVTPDWVQHTVFYQIFPDRFGFSWDIEKPNNLETWERPPTIHGFKGGDLLGVLEKLDYLQDLGITAIYLNPIFQSASNHRYHTHDYYQVDPILGGNQIFEKLLKEVHRRNMRIVLDGVFNHASRGFFQFNHILETGASSPYLDWFHVKDFPLNAYLGRPQYKSWRNLPALPEFNTENPQVRKYLLDIARYWVDKGIDGWRLDVPFCIDDDSFWQEFRSVVKEGNPDAYITGEIVEDATRWLQGDQFDGVMNYLFTYACWGFFGGPFLKKNLLGHWMDHGGDLIQPTVEKFSQDISKLLKKYPKPAVQAQMNLLDSHDTPRAMTLFRCNHDRLKLAVLFMMTYPGAPCIYYGDEVGLEGGPDPDCRRAFPRYENKFDQDLLSFYKKCIALRHKYEVLRLGEFKSLYARDLCFVYLRQMGNEPVVVVAINNSADAKTADIDVDGSLKDGIVLSNHLGIGELSVQNGKINGLELAPWSGGFYVQ